jgi:hypothetical protein
LTILEPQRLRGVSGRPIRADRSAHATDTRRLHATYITEEDDGAVRAGHVWLQRMVKILFLFCFENEHGQGLTVYSTSRSCISI